MGKVVVVHAEHRFVGYKSDCDYMGNASFTEDLHMVAYIKEDKAKKFVADYARKTGMVVCGSDGLYANKKPDNENYESEHEYIETISPGSFLFYFGTLRYGLEEAKGFLGKVAEKDMAKYLEIVDQKCESYDPY